MVLENKCKPDTLAYKILELRKAGKLEDGLTSGQIAKILNREKSSVRYALKTIKRDMGIDLYKTGTTPKQASMEREKHHIDIEMCKSCNWWKPLDGYSSHECFCSFCFITGRMRPKENGTCKGFDRRKD